MPFSQTSIPGLIIFDPLVFEDKRGYFTETYNQKVFREAGIHEDFVQDNQSKSVKGVLRGLHYQLNPHAQGKLVRVLSGEVLDVALDLRKGSPTFGQHHAERLSAENRKQMYVPAGFAHGFIVLSDSAEFFYKCTGFYNKESERGIRFDDPALGIDWGLPADQLIVSDKDVALPMMADAEHNFEFQSNVG